MYKFKIDRFLPNRSYLLDKNDLDYSNLLLKHRYISQAPDRILDAPNLNTKSNLSQIDWSSKNNLAVVLDYNKIYILNNESNKVTCINPIINKYPDYISSISWSPNGNNISIGSDKNLQIWDLNKSKIIHNFRSHKDRIMSISWRNHNEFSSYSLDNCINHYDLRVGGIVKNIINNEYGIKLLKWNNNGQKLAYCSNNKLSLHNLINKDSELCGNINVFDWCPYNSNIITGTDNSIDIFDVINRKIKKTKNVSSKITDIICSRTNKELVTIHNSNIIKIRNKQLFSMTNLNNDSKILNIIVNPNGNQLCVLNKNERVNIWNIFPERKKIYSQIIPHPMNIR